MESEYQAIWNAHQARIRNNVACLIAMKNAVEMLSMAVRRSFVGVTANHGILQEQLDQLSRLIGEMCAKHQEFGRESIETVDALMEMFFPRINPVTGKPPTQEEVDQIDQGFAELWEELQQVVPITQDSSDLSKLGQTVDVLNNMRLAARIEEGEEEVEVPCPEDFGPSSGSTTGDESSPQL